MNEVGNRGAEVIANAVANMPHLQAFDVGGMKVRHKHTHNPTLPHSLTKNAHMGSHRRIHFRPGSLVSLSLSGLTPPLLRFFFGGVVAVWCDRQQSVARGHTSDRLGTASAGETDETQSFLYACALCVYVWACVCVDAPSRQQSLLHRNLFWLIPTLVRSRPLYGGVFMLTVCVNGMTAITSSDAMTTELQFLSRLTQVQYLNLSNLQAPKSM